MTYSEEFLAARGSPNDPGYVKFLEQRCEILLHHDPNGLIIYDAILTPPFPYVSTYARCNADHQKSPQRLLPEHAKLFFDSCSLRYTDFSRERGLSTHSRFLNCDLTGAKFARLARLHLAVFVHCNLSHADFGAANLDTVVFIDCNLAGANLIDTSLWAAAFVGCNTQEAYMLGASVVAGTMELPGYEDSYRPHASVTGKMIPLALDVPWIEDQARGLGYHEGLATALTAEHPRLSPNEILALCNALSATAPTHPRDILIP